MPDITMCLGEGCSVKHYCYRYMAPPTEGRQAYFMESPGKDADCEYFMPITEVRDDEETESDE